MCIWASLVAQLVKESACNSGDLGSILGLGRAPGRGHDSPLQYSCLGNPMDRGALGGYSPWCHRELDMTEWLILSHPVNQDLKFAVAPSDTPAVKENKGGHCLALCTGPAHRPFSPSCSDTWLARMDLEHPRVSL